MNIAFDENSWTSSDDHSTSKLATLAQQLSTTYSPLDVRRNHASQISQYTVTLDSRTETGSTANEEGAATSTIWRFVLESLNTWKQHAVTAKSEGRAASSRPYSWPTRINEIRVNIAGTLPAISPRLIEFARRLAFYSDERARSHGLQIQPVIAPIDDGRVHIEWNRRGSVVRHVECTIANDPEFTLSLLTTLESRKGEILRATEIQNASILEVLAEIENFFARSMSQI